MERSTMMRYGAVGLLIAFYAVARVSSDRAAAPPAEQPTPPPSTGPAQVTSSTVAPALLAKLQKKDLKVGTGKEAKPGNVIIAHYRGTLTDGKEFDASYNRGDPFTFVLGQGRVIKGWDLGIAGMKEKGKRRLTVPPELGYGAQGQPPTIPPNATLIFEVELIKVVDTKAPRQPPVPQ